MNSTKTLLAVLSLICGVIALAPFEARAQSAPVVILSASGALPRADAVTEPFSVSFLGDGTMLGVEFTRGNRVFKLDGEQKLSFIAGRFWQAADEKAETQPDDGADPLAAQFIAMHDIAVLPSGDAVVAETFANRIRKLNLSTGAVSTLAGDGVAGFAGDGGPIAGARFNQAFCVALSPDGSKIYVADLGNARVRELDLAHNRVSTVAGNGHRGAVVDGALAVESPLNGPRACAVARDGTVYIVQREGNSLLAIRHGHIHVVVNRVGAKGYFGDNGPAIDAKLNGPKYICIDPHDNVILCDTENNCLRRYEPKTGLIRLIAGQPPRGGATVGDTLLTTSLHRPHGARFDRQGRLYIVDSYNNRVIRADYK